MIPQSPIRASLFRLKSSVWVIVDGDDQAYHREYYLKGGKQMRLPKRGERGFTLIELLIVVAILGVLAAVIIPNVQRFIGAGETEAQETELSNIQLAVTAMMVDNNLSILPDGYVDGTALLLATNDMSAFPHKTAAIGVAGQKETDPDGTTYFESDKNGYILYGHDIDADGVADDLVNYVAQPQTAYWYIVTANGTVSQEPTEP